MRGASVQPAEVSSIFEERAEYLSRDDLERWTALSDRERQVVSKLRGNGAKLLIGPRGSGKSTLLRLAYYQLLDGSDALPIYVNYARHLALEPLFHRSPDAPEVFRQWVLAKVVVGVRDMAAEADVDDVALANLDLMVAAETYVDDLQRGSVTRAFSLSPARLSDLLLDWATALGRKRVVLLFDDAAHAFSPAQQREFFEIFRQLRSRLVAPKAAVYPGVTNYSSNMHIGHDAELVEAWYRSDDATYVATMREVLEKRLPDYLQGALSGERSDLLEYLALASFGLPRSFLTMVQDVLGYDEDEQQSSQQPTRRRADEAVARTVGNVRQVFESTGVKIPRYSNLISEGRRLEDAFLKALQGSNSSKKVGAKVTTVGIKRPVPKEFNQVLDLMAYAGIIRHVDSQSRGSAGVFERYELHYGFIIASNALSLGRSPSTADVVSSLRKRPAPALVRGKPETFLGEGYRLRCTLNLTPCGNCGSPRVSEEAQFCMQCGKPLSEKSLYEELLQQPLTELPIPEKKKQALDKTTLKTVQDILLDVEFKELLRGHYVGAVWAKKIHAAAEEYLSV